MVCRHGESGLDTSYSADCVSNLEICALNSQTKRLTGSEPWLSIVNHGKIPMRSQHMGAGYKIRYKVHDSLEHYGDQSWELLVIQARIALVTSSV